MKFRVWKIFIIVAILFHAGFALAQEGGDIANEFEAFKKKLQSAQGQGGDSSPSSPTASAPSIPESAASPLGNLPENKSPLATPSASSPLSPISSASNVSPISAVPPSGSTSLLGPAGNLPLAQTINGINNTAPAANAQGRQDYMKKQQDLMKRKAFEEGLDALMPLEPELIRELLQEFKKTREATETPIAVPTPKTEVKTVSLDPSDPPIVIKVSPGYVTALTLLDSTGAPWAIQDVTWAGKFKITGGEMGSHILRIVPENSHGSGNISLRMIDLITPITFSVETGLDEVHYRFDARIPKRGPLAKAPLIDSSSMDSVMVGNDSKMVDFLEGTPPSQAEQLLLNGVDERTKAWRSGKNIYLRTPLTLLSPSWDSSVSSADGMNVYTLSDAPVLLLSDQGNMVKAYVVNELGEKLE